MKGGAQPEPKALTPDDVRIAYFRAQLSAFGGNMFDVEKELIRGLFGCTPGTLNLDDVERAMWEVVSRVGDDKNAFIHETMKILRAQQKGTKG